jgi:hypothetical protein
VHEDRRVSVFEQQQTTYTLLQDVLMRKEGWEGVVADGKARALAMDTVRNSAWSDSKKTSTLTPRL